jgi:hypothetical protein
MVGQLLPNTNENATVHSSKFDGAEFGQLNQAYVLVHIFWRQADGGCLYLVWRRLNPFTRRSIGGLQLSHAYPVLYYRPV